MLTVLTVSMIFGNYVNINDEKCDSFAKIQVLCQNCQQNKNPLKLQTAI